MYKLYLDDERNPKHQSYVVCRTVDEAMTMIKERGFPTDISLDHDLGENQKSGYDFVKEFAEYVLKNNYVDKDTFLKINWNFHTANPVGRDNMSAYVNSMAIHIMALTMIEVNNSLKKR